MTFQSWAATCFLTVGALLALIYRRELWAWARECFEDEEGYEYDTELANYAQAAKAAEAEDLFGDRDDIYGWHDNDVA